MDHERFQDLKEAYALGALSEEERREVESYLEENPSAQAEMDELSSVASLMALAPEEQAPPERLRKSLLKRVRAETGHGPAASASRTTGGWLPRLFGLRGIAAGAAVIALAALLIWNVALQTELQQTRDFQMSAYELQGSGEAVEAQGEVVSLDGERAMLVATDLPDLPEDRTYEMWTIDEGENPRSCGLFDAGEEPSIETIDQSLTGAETFAITVEPEGGSPQPTSEPIVRADLRSRA